MTKIYIILTLLTLLFSLSCTDRIVYEDSQEDLNPVFSPPGPYMQKIPQTVTITTELPSAVIRYTTDGSNPTPSSTIYDSPLNVTENNTTIKAQAFKDGWYPSDIISTNYQLKVATPVFNPPGGFYQTGQTVTINCATEGATIRYTLNGNDPTVSSPQYSVPVNVPVNTTLKARAFKDGWAESKFVSAEYTNQIAGMALVERGTFNPSSDYTVTLSSFYISIYEVTQSEYQSVMGTNPSHFSGKPNCPVEMVSWFNAIEYCNRLSIQEGLTPAYSYSTHGTNPDNWSAGWNTSSANHTNVSGNWEANGYRLPTEMEWEFAARGGLPAQNEVTFNDTWAGTNEEAHLVQYSWYNQNSGGSTHPPGTKLPNELGLYDMSGNVWEWNWDIYDGYPNGSHNDPEGASSGSRRVLRGGSWDSDAVNCRVGYRGYLTAMNRSPYLGFRVSRTLNLLPPVK